MTECAEDLQAEALRAFTFLTALRAEWNGALTIACGLGSGGQALSIAANIAGGACVALDERTEVCRAALRSGACDFLVSTVDEALRILKNELRRRQPISVALHFSVEDGLTELLDRGVLPELFTGFRNDEHTTAVMHAVRGFADIGTRVVDFDGALAAVAGALNAAQSLEDFMREDGLRLEAFEFSSAAELRSFDAKLLEIIPARDARQRWVAAASRFFHRERPYRRVACLKAEERERLS